MNQKKSLAVVCSVLIPAICLATSSALPASRVQSLAGAWRFQLDRNDVGMRERWFDKSLSGRVMLPGALAAQGIGDEISLDTKWTGNIIDRSFFTSPEYEKYRQPGNIKIPFWLQPERYYAGAAWYQRDIEVPLEWKGRRITLTLERPHWETRVWVDSVEAGTRNALGTPHEFDIGTALAPGQHTLSIRVDNRMVIDVGINSHSVSDHTQGNWNGIAGRIELAATSPVWIDDLQVYPHVGTSSVTVKGRIGNATGRPGSGSIKIAVRPDDSPAKNKRPPARSIDKDATASWGLSGGSFETEIQLDTAAKTWDEFNPHLYRITVSLDRSTDSRTVTFGLREISTLGTQFLINGRRLFIRGTLECAIFPLTGHPPLDVESWRRIIRIAKAHGLNNMRFHSWCPPEAAFVAADQLGFYLMVECSSWANSSTTLGDGRPVDQWIYEEADRILRAYGNHPSFLFMPYGNEPGGKKHREFLAAWVNHYRAKDGRRLYAAGSGWPQINENQFHVSPDPRIQAWGAGLKSRINAKPPETVTDYRDYIAARQVPVISHEIGQWCVYPNFDEIPKYKGYLKPKNFDIFRDRLLESGMLDRARQFLLASGKLQTLCYKEDIESALRTPGMGGFQLLDLHDFPGQGSALVGVLDPFWESKGYVTAAEYSRFCGSTVPLARLAKRVFTSDETLAAGLEVAHFGAQAMRAATTKWKIVDESGRILRSGRLAARDIPVGNGIQLGEIRVPLSFLVPPIHCRLIVGIEGTTFENGWDVWVYQPRVHTTAPEGIRLVNELDDQTAALLKKGEKVLLLIPPEQVAPDEKLGKVELGFSSIFWNTAWTRRQAPHTLGILCDPKHPALASFPTEYHSNWQWWYLVSRAGAMILRDLPVELKPTVQVIDDWFTARRLALLFEATVGEGRILVCSVDLQNGLDANPVARQMRHSLLRYMGGSSFRPQTSVTVEQIQGLIVQKQAAP